MRPPAIFLYELARFVACILTVLLWFVLGLLCMPEADGAPMAPRVARITVYAPDEPRADFWTRRRRGATGARLRDGHCAVDRRLIPLGSVVVVAGRSYVAADTGAFRGWRVDIYFDRWSDAVLFDRSSPDYLPITVIPPRS